MAKDDAEQTVKLLYSFFLVISQCLNFMCWRFKTFCQFHLHRWCKQKNSSCLHHCWRWNWQSSKTSAHRIQMCGITQKKE